MNQNTNRKRVMLVSSAIILLCLMLIAGFSFALFTDDEIVENHLRAGTLDLTLTRTKLTSTYLDEGGYMKPGPVDTTIKDFTNDKNENIFDFVDGMRVVPGCEFSADLKLQNNTINLKSDVACAYWIEIVYKGGTDEKFAEQVMIKVSIDGVEHTLKEGVTIGSETDPLGILGVNESTTFTVTLKFLDLDETVNNLAQGDTATYDLCVHAVQYTGNRP